MHNLTQRQIEVLKTLIEEYITSAEPVGSETLEKKYSLSISPATIRNEMVRLTELGYLHKPHTSAGRAPTPLGMKFYVTQLMKEKELSVAEEVAVKEKLWDYRDRTERFLKEVTRELAEKTKTVAVATAKDGTIYASGFANILDMPEFYDIDVTKNLLELLDEFDYFQTICANVTGSEDVHVLLGEDLGPKLPASYGFVFTHYETPMHLEGEIGVVGPVRLNYTSVIPTVRYFRDLITEIAQGW